MNNTSKTNWEKIDSMTEDDIDTSDIPPLNEEFFKNSRWWKPVKQLQVIVPIEPETLAWFQSQNEDYETKMAEVLKIYAESHQV